MKKSMIATAVVATAGLAASANAGYFVIQNASYQESGNPSNNPTLSVPNLQAGTAAAALGSSSAFDFSGGSSGNVSDLTTTATGHIATAIGLTAPSGTAGQLMYFGWDSSGGAPAYFGVAYRAGTGGGSISFNFNNATSATDGVWSTGGVGQFGAVSSTGYTSGPVTLTAGETFIAVFANLAVGATVGGSGEVQDSAFDVDYLSYDGSSWGSVASATNAQSSNLNVTTYAVPVPAPALLAGAGLVGAAALRRRMAKKA